MPHLNPCKYLVLSLWLLSFALPAWAGDVEIQLGIGDAFVVKDSGASAVLEVDGDTGNISYGNSVFVSATGTDTENGNRLLSVMAGLGAASSTNRHLIQLDAGIYALGNSGLNMQAYVDIAGSGESITTITSSHSSVSEDANSATVIGANNMEVRFVTVENSGGGTYSIAIRNNGASPQISHVTTRATGGSNNYGISNGNTSSPTIQNSKIGGATFSIKNTSSTALVALSQLDGVVDGNDFRCINAHTPGFVILDYSCVDPNVNLAPSIASVAISPTGPFTNTTLTCAVSGVFDPNGDPVSIIYQWFINGVPGGGAASTLPSANFQKSDAIWCTATPDDGQLLGPTVQSNTETILNSPPTVNSLTIPSTPGTGSTVVPTFSLMDLDADPVLASYQWFVNGIPVATTSTLASIFTSAADQVWVIITPNDGTASGPPVQSNTATIQP